MARYKQYDKMRPIVQLSARFYVKYCGIIEFDKRVCIVMQETQKAYLILPDNHKDKLRFGVDDIWIPKSKVTEIKEILKIDVTKNWRGKIENTIEQLVDCTINN